MKRTNYVLIFGLLASIAIVLGAIVMEIDGQNPAVFLHPVSLLVVLGGTVTWSLVSLPFKELVRVVQRTYFSIRYPKTDFLDTVREIIRVSVGVNRDVLYVETGVNEVNNVMLRDGLQFISMGFKGDDIRRFLEVRREQNEAGLNQSAVLYFNLSKLGPALGLIGTLLGLVILLYYNMGDGNMERVGSSMGVALTATLYGVALSNLIFAPLSEYMQHMAERSQLLDTLIIEGVVLIKERKHPVYIVQALKSYLPREEMAQMDDIVREETTSAKPSNEKKAA